MKIRNGFVSNSSSSSFMIYGTGIESVSEDLYNKVYKSLNEEEQGEFKNYIGEFDEMEGAEFFEYLENILPDGISRYYGSSYDDEYYFGTDPCSANDDETFGEWKSDIEEKLNSMFGDDTGSFGWQEYCGYDG